MPTKYQFNHKLICEEYLKSNLSVPKFAKRFNCSPSYIHHILKKCNIKCRGAREKFNLEKGQKLNRWIYLGEKILKNNQVHILCECDCGKIKYVSYNLFKKGNSKSCGCYHKYKMKCINWTGVGDLSGSYWDIIKRGAKLRKHKLEISIEYAWNLFLKQNGKCALSGMDIEFPKKSKDRGFRTASLDRIDSTKGYIEGNVQWVHKKINLMKNKLVEKEFLFFCRKVSEYAKSNGDLLFQG